MDNNLCSTEPVGDIEDIINKENGDVDIRASPHGQVVRHPRRKNAATRASKLTPEKCEQTDVSACDSFIPEKYSVYSRTWGCSHNTSDSEFMAGLLSKAGFQITENKENADIWLLNSCTVKTPAEHHFMNDILEGAKKGKRVVAAGCVPQAEPGANYLEDISIVGTHNIERVAEVVEETLKGSVVRLLGFPSHRKATAQNGNNRSARAGPDLSLPKIRRNPLVEIISINSGCLNHCTYCKTKRARGDLASYLPEEIVARAKEAFADGVVELWLTSEDTGAYGKDIGVTLPQLLYQLVEVIPEGCRMRIGMTNPPYIYEYLEDIAKILAHPRVYSFLHIPVQSGSDYVLREMKREYNVDDFSRIVDFLTERLPEISIATDFICAFPTETDKDFDASLALIEKYRFASVFINQYFARPGTPAARLPQLDKLIAKQRTKRMSELFQGYRTYDYLVGRIEDVLIAERSFDGRFLVGHTKNYVQVLVPDAPGLMGKMVRVHITEAPIKHSVRGEVVTGDESSAASSQHQTLKTTKNEKKAHQSNDQQQQKRMQMLLFMCLGVVTSFMVYFFSDSLLLTSLPSS